MRVMRFRRCSSLGFEAASIMVPCMCNHTVGNAAPIAAGSGMSCLVEGDDDEDFCDTPL